jgi:ribulose-phosphate 3-epimerase
MNAVHEVLVSASILNADFSRLDRVVHKLERAGADRLHRDVMDGHFVDNIPCGPDVVAAFRRLTDMPLDVHLMISEPARYIDRFIEAEPQTIAFHVETTEPARRKTEAIAAIRAAGQGAGLAVSPDTPVSALDRWIDQLDVILVMSVHPGWGGQGFIPEAAPKIAQARAKLAAAGRGGLVHVDGGVNSKTAEVVGAQGIDVCVVGSALFQRGQDAADEVSLVKELARHAYEIAHEPRPHGRTSGSSSHGSARAGSR